MISEKKNNNHQDGENPQHGSRSSKKQTIATRGGKRERANSLVAYFNKGTKPIMRAPLSRSYLNLIAFQRPCVQIHHTRN